jgi:hypothetical protein
MMKMEEHNLAHLFAQAIPVKPQFGATKRVMAA